MTHLLIERVHSRGPRKAKGSKGPWCPKELVQENGKIPRFPEFPTLMNFVIGFHLSIQEKEAGNKFNKNNEEVSALTDEKSEYKCAPLKQHNFSNGNNSTKLNLQTQEEKLKKVVLLRCSPTDTITIATGISHKKNTWRRFSFIF